jgi:AraC-like DNA-binding protein
VRRELAARYLADPQRSLADISSLLGFSSLSGFLALASSAVRHLGHRAGGTDSDA